MDLSFSVDKSIEKDVEIFKIKTRDEIMEKMLNRLDRGGDIDYIFAQKDPRTGHCFGTILHYSIAYGYQRIVEYALSRGASVAIEMPSEKQSRYRNAVELAALYLNRHNFRKEASIFRILRKRSLELYSSFGLTPLHLDCAITCARNWSEEAERCVKSGHVNVTISPDSPLWPASTPIHIAAKFFVSHNTQVVERLLALGADPAALDLEKKTPLHYLFRSFCDKRLFAPDARDTLGSFNGETHFHIACRLCPYSLDIVKRYLDQGISPDLPNSEGIVGLNIAWDAGCVELVQLLIEYGADFNREDSIAKLFQKSSCPVTRFEIICLLIEVGLDQKKIAGNCLRSFCGSQTPTFFRCILKLTELNKNLVSEEFMDVYLEAVKKYNHDWNEAEYVGRCSEELRDISKLGLRQILDGTAIVQPDFKSKLQRLDSFAFCKYPIYGRMLKIRSKQKLLELKKKKKLIPHAAPVIQELFKSLCHLPDLCADMILWNLTGQELDQFL